MKDNNNGISSSPNSMPNAISTPSTTFEPATTAIPFAASADTPNGNSPIDTDTSIASISQQSNGQPVVSIGISDGSGNSTTSQLSTSLSNFAHSKTDVMIAGAVVLVLIAVVVGFMIFGSHSSGEDDDDEESKRLVDEDELGSSRRIRRKRGDRSGID